MSEFHFLRPYWFLALIPLAFLIWRWSQKALSHTGWKGVIDEALLPYVLTDHVEGGNDSIGTSLSKKSRSKIVFAVAGILAIVALAGPVFERLPQPVFRSDTALVIGLDLSRSMDAEDLKPSRLARARYKIADLLKQRKEGQTALLVYAGEAFVVTPLTDDTATILSQMKALTTDLMPAQGNRTDKALQKAGELLLQAGAKRGDILLITDGVSNGPSGQNLDKVQEAAMSLKNKGYRLLMLGIGTRQGAPIKLPDGDYLTDAAGNIVIPSLKENELKQVTGSVGGIYQKYTRSDKDIDRLTLLLDVNPDEGEVLATDLSVERWREDGPWLLLLILPLAALVFRKGVLLVVVLSVSNSVMFSEVEASDLWRNADQLGADLMEKGDAAKAATEFEDTRWKASAQYQAGDYEGALKSWSELEQSTNGSETSGDPGNLSNSTNKQVQDLYNIGNAQVKTGDYPAALESYKQALQKAPDFEDAQYNYDLVKEALEKQQKQEDQGKDENGDKGEEKESENGSDKENKQQEGDKGQEKDQEKGQGEDDSEEQSGSEGADSQEQQSSGDSSDQQTESGGDESRDQEKDNSQKNDQALEAKQEQDAQKSDGQAQQAESLSDETQQALEQWLRRIPDDPGGLLRRKFIYQYKRQHQAEQGSANTQAW